MFASLKECSGIALSLRFKGLRGCRNCKLITAAMASRHLH
jgi:hypothetical protein